VTDRQIEALMARGYGSFSDIVRTGVDIVYREEMAMETKRIAELAEGIYGEVYGDIDNKKFHSHRVSEITDWLAVGEPLEGDETIEDLAREWQFEHTGDDDLQELVGAEFWSDVEHSFNGMDESEVLAELNTMYPHEDGNEDLAKRIVEALR
jgi:hypothetical protein